MKTCDRVQSLIMHTAFKMIFSQKNSLVHVHILPIFSLYALYSQEMDDQEVVVHEPKCVGGRTKIHNNFEGLSEDVIIEKNLRMPEGSDEDQKTRDNRLQMLRRLQ